MSNHDNTLKKLTSQREINVKKLVNWSFDDFTEMLETYQQARVAAAELGDMGSVAVLNEKISQLEEARTLKDRSGSGEENL